MTEQQVTDNTDKLIRVDQVMQLYTRLPLAAGATFIIATILLAAQWPVINHSILLGWWGVMIVITSARWMLVLRYRRAKPASANIEAWATRFSIGTVCAGLAWGAAGFLLFPEQDLAHQVVLILVLSGMASAAVTTLASVWEDIVVFLCLMLIPLMLRFFLIGTKIYLIMGAVTLFYLIGLSLSARRMHNNFMEIINLRIADMEQGAKLLEGEEKYRNVVERSNDGIGIIQEGIIRYANKRLAGIAGYTVEEIEGTPFADYIHPDELHKVVDRYKRRVAGEDVPSIYETVLKHKNGSRLFVEHNVGIIKYQGKPAELAIVRDRTERKRAEEALREKERLFRLLAENTSDIIFLLDMNLNNVYVSPAVEKLRGYTLEEHMKQPVKETLTPESYQRMIRLYQQKLGELKTVSKDTALSTTIEVEYLCKDGSTFWGEAYASVVRDESGQPIGIQGSVRDITDRKGAEEALKESEEKFRNFVETSADLVFRLSKTGYIEYVSPRVEDLYGYHPDELIGKHLKVTTPVKEVPRAIKALKRVLGGKLLKNFEINQKAKNGQIIPMEINAVPVKKDGKIVGLQGIMRDITGRKQAEEQIRAALKGKEILLKEIHHRVKNNLQTISSLLNLQSRYIKDKQALEVFKNSQERIRAMALIHEKLYQSRDLENIDFAEYIQSLVAYLFDSGSLSSGQVQLKMKIEDVALNIDTAIPLGLIINELVANSFKYAFPDNRKGDLQVFLGKSEDEEYDYTLVVRDNGIGFPGDLDFRSSDTLGMLLVSTLVKQLRGVIDLERKDGTTFTIKFKELKYKKKI